MTSFRLTRWLLAAPMALAALALAFGAMALSPATTEAAPKISSSIGVGCSVKNGTATLKLKLTAKATGTGNIVDSVILYFDDVNPPVDTETIPAAGSASYSYTHSENVTSGTYYAKFVAEDGSGNIVTKTARADISISGNSVSCRVRTPA